MEERKTIPTWSFSSLTSYEQCPYRSFLKRIKRLPVNEQPADSPMLRGNKIHDLAEEYTDGRLAEMPKELKKFKIQFEGLRELYNSGSVSLEQGWGFDINWEPCKYDDWGTVWHQSKCDAVVQTDETTFTIIDYKTGKSWGNEVKHTQQGALYAVALMCLYPQAESIIVEFWYLDEGKTKRRAYTREKLLRQMASFTKRGVAMTSATEFPPKANKMNCLYCDYGVNKGNGKCQYAVDPNL